MKGKMTLSREELLFEIDIFSMLSLHHSNELAKVKLKASPDDFAEGLYWGQADAFALTAERLAVKLGIASSVGDHRLEERIMERRRAA